MRHRTAALILLMLCAAPAAHADGPSDTPPAAMPAGAYALDPRHTCVLFRISHFGFSHFTGRFDKVEGSFDYRPDAPADSVLDVTIYPGSVDTNDKDLDEDLNGENWFDPLKFPRATFHATHIDIVDARHMKITGDFTMHGQTHNLTLDAELVGAGTEPGFGTQVMGFSAVGHFDRSAYGMSNLVPLVGDEVTLQIDTEFDKEK